MRTTVVLIILAGKTAKNELANIASHKITKFNMAACKAKFDIQN